MWERTSPRDDGLMAGRGVFVRIFFPVDGRRICMHHAVVLWRSSGRHRSEQYRHTHTQIHGERDKGRERRERERSCIFMGESPVSS